MGVDKIVDDIDNVSKVLFFDDEEADFEAALRKWRVLAEQGFAEPQFNLGVMHHSGMGVVQNYSEAVKWYRKAAEQGYAEAQFNLGMMYANGDGVIQSMIYAYMWLNISASNGSAGAAKGKELVEQKMTAQDISKAQRFLQEYLDRNSNLNSKEYLFSMGHLCKK